MAVSGRAGTGNWTVEDITVLAVIIKLPALLF